MCVKKPRIRMLDAISIYPLIDVKKIPKGGDPIKDYKSHEKYIITLWPIYITFINKLHYSYGHGH